MRTCTWCKQSKSLDDFYKMPTAKDGIRPECKECTKKRNKRDRNASKMDVCECGAVKMKIAPVCRECKSLVQDSSFTSTDKYGYKFCIRDGKTISAHRWIMERQLNRQLLPGENVHHINGVRSDNRIENLELWVSHQPSGQRPEDLLAWANEIIRRYGGSIPPIGTS